MSGTGGFWRKMASAFVEYEAVTPTAPPPAPDDLPDTEALLAQLDGAKKAAAPPPVPVELADLPEGQPFTELYAAAGVPAVHHTAEQMLQILDGLSAMPGEARRMAVQAMDAADDRWTLEDVVLDARHKREVLAKHCERLSATARAAEQRIVAEKAEADELLAQAQIAIREQITQLEAELATFRQDATERKARSDAELYATSDRVARETARHQAEVTRLQRIQAFFEAQPATSATTT